MAEKSTRKALLRPLLILAAFAVGSAMPQLSCFRGAMRYILMLMLFFIFSKLDFAELRPRKQHLYLLLANLLLPLAVYGGFMVLGMRDLALAAFFIAITPTATAAPVILSFLGGNINFVVSCFIITNLGVIGALFFLIPLLVTGKSDLAEFGRVGLNLAITMVVPAVVAQLTRHLMPTGEVWRQRFTNLNFYLWVVLLVLQSVFHKGHGNRFIIAAIAVSLVTALYLTFLRNNPWQIFLLLIPICAIVFLSFRIKKR